MNPGGFQLKKKSKMTSAAKSANAKSSAAVETSTAAAVTTACDGIERGKRNNCSNRSNTDHQFSEHGSLLPERAPNR